MTYERQLSRPAQAAAEAGSSSPDEVRAPTQQRNARILRSYEFRLQNAATALAQQHDAGVADSLQILQEMITRAKQLNLVNPPAEVAESIEEIGRMLTVTEGQITGN